MDRLNQIRGEAGSSRDLTLDTTTPPSEAFMTANESSSKYFSLSEVDSTFSISPSKDSLTTNADTDRTITVDSELISNLSPIPKKSDLDSFKIGKQIEAVNILSGGVNIFDDNDNSYDGDELVIDDNVIDEKDLKLDTELPLEKNENLDTILDEIPSKDTEVVLQIDGKNVDAIDIGNGLYLYRKAGQEELAAVQIIDDDQQQPSFKFLKVRENNEGNLEVYEEIEVEVPKEVPIKEGNLVEKTPHVPIKDISKVINEPSSNKIADKINKTPKNDANIINELCETVETPETKAEVNLNGKMMKFSESRKSPVIGTYTPMTYHSTPNKEGIPLTKTMVDQQLHPSRHSDNVKKTIEVHTDSCRQKLLETPTKIKDEMPKGQDSCDHNLSVEDSVSSPAKEVNQEISNEATLIPDIKESASEQVSNKGESKKFEETELSPNALQIDEPDSVIENDKMIEVESDSTNKIDLPASNENFEKDKVPQNSTIIEDDKKEEEEMENKVKIAKQEEKITKNILFDKINGAVISDILEGATESDLKNLNTIEKESKTIKMDTVESKKEETVMEPIEQNIQSTESLNQDNIQSKNTNEIISTANTLIVENNVERTNEEESNIKTDSTEIGDESKLIHAFDNNKITEDTNSNVTEKCEKSTDEIKEKCIEIENHSTTVIEDIENTSLIKTTPMDVVNDLTENKIVESEEINSEPKNNPKKDIEKAENDKIVTSKKKIKDTQNSLQEDLKEIKNVDIVPLKSNEKLILHTEMKAKCVEKNNVETTVQTKVNEENKLPSIPNNHIPEKNSPESSKTVKELTPNIVSESIKNEDKNLETRKEIPKPKIVPPKAINNNNSAVPFGKWTEANRQEFLNKIKETKIPSNYPNTKQLKQANDLNRRDVLKKIDSQRQSATVSAKANDYGNMSKINTKVDNVFINKANVNQVNKLEVKPNVLKPNATFVKKPIIHKKVNKDDPPNIIPPAKKPSQRKEINNQDLIDKTIEGIINRAVTGNTKGENKEEKTVKHINTTSTPDSFDDIEKKMNELHGIPFEERSAHEMSQVVKNDPKKKARLDNPKIEKSSKIPNLVPFKNKEQNVMKEKFEEVSDEEIIEHIPITGDVEANKQNIVAPLSIKEKSAEKHEPNKEAIITERDFDKFVRRNSVTYENCLTLSIDGKEPHNVIQTVVEKEVPAKKLSRNELMLAESKAKSASKQQNLMRHNAQSNKIPPTSKAGNEEEPFTKNYQSKVQIAYQSVMTKRNAESPIKMIEDKPVKVVYMDTNMEYTPLQSNIQGPELSPPKKKTSEMCDAAHSASESLDSDTLESLSDIKSQDETKIKSKHQRKQVLTPVEEPELELIEPVDLGIEVSPKKKRKLDDKGDKIKNVVPKKSYLLHRSVIDEEVPKSHDSVKNTSNESKNIADSFKTHTDTISAIDNLVKAAELIETQAEKKTTTLNVSNSSLDNSLNTPVKRGRGRPRKYPLPDQASDVKAAPSPQKKPRLIDAKVAKSYTDSDDSSDGEIVKENWTMGKINENIVCPICNKLFRSENVVFKHVKHCTGPSPNRSDSDNRSPRRLRRSTDDKSRESLSDFTDSEEEKEVKVRSRKSRHYYSHDHDDVIVIEETPIKEKAQKSKLTEAKKTINKNKIQSHTNNLMCEFCGKTFRQLSYLVNHKIQHKKEDLKNAESEDVKTVFSCEVCKKDFRKLHHLVQHRIIHNSNTMSSRQHRKSSSEQQESKSLKNLIEAKQTDDPSAGFRCEPCDKSFRKLHHLVEHRETHDGINKKGSSITQNISDTKPSQAYHCDICKKSYKKLADFLEHKEQHLETSSEKSDDKSVKSSLSTKDIIHECSLCYMVFPNEHSLNKHTVICLRKKNQSMAKQAAKKTEGEETIETEDGKSDENVVQEIVPIEHSEQIKDVEMTMKPQKGFESLLENKQLIVKKDVTESLPIKDTTELEKKKPILEPKSINRLSSDKGSIEDHNRIKFNINEDIEKPSKTEKAQIKECITIPDTPTPKKKLPIKEKVAPTVTKRQKTVNITLPDVSDVKPAVESSDDDEVRYMLNPNFKDEDCSEAKMFMKVRAKKRNSLQIERPNSKDLIKRRISLQHPPKIPRLKVKAIEPKPINSLAVEKRLKLAKTEPLPNTDSDDSDVKYSFPVQNAPEPNTSKDNKQIKKHTITAKRKSLSGIAKRKSLGKHKLTTPINKTKKRTTEIEHRCDCGQLFSSAALLSRHTTLAHTPPRIRRRRSPPPDTQAKNQPQTNNKPQISSKPQTKTKLIPSKKVKTDVTNSNIPKVGTRKSSVNNDVKVSGNKSNEPAGKVLRSAAHRGVPVPEKMRKLMEKSKK